ncbi:hypothetical protein [Halarchaeum sp. P4]|uniref:hypothetical protein n=1 Tax=Halarchaeum sp. P4 TaxID=3421639 RepID=UPI003EBB16D6
MQTATRVRLAAACCLALGALGAGLVALRAGATRPALLAACLLVVLVGVLLFGRAEGAEERKPGW